MKQNHFRRKAKTKNIRKRTKNFKGNMALLVGTFVFILFHHNLLQEKKSYFLICNLEKKKLKEDKNFILHFPIMRRK